MHRRLLRALGAEGRATGSAEDAIARVQFLSFALASLVYVAIDVPGQWSQFPALNPAWAIVTYTTIVWLPILIGMLSPTAPLAVLRGLATAYALAFVLTMATWMPAMTVSTMPGGVEPYPSNLSALAAAAVALGWRPLPTWVFTAYLAIGEALLHHAATDAAPRQVAQEALYMFLLSAVIIVLLHISRAAARATDEAARYAAEETAREAAAHARSVETSRVNALLHDHVLAALMLASRSEAVPPEALARGARVAIDTLTPDAPESAGVSGDDLVARLRALALEVPDVRVTVHGKPVAEIPAHAADALGEALAEALRNSARHAGPGAQRSVDVRFRGPSVEVTFADDGVGFDPHRIAPDRLGVRVSIRGRMRAAGGEASVSSLPGRGTRIDLRWTEEPA